VAGKPADCSKGQVRSAVSQAKGRFCGGCPHGRGFLGPCVSCGGWNRLLHDVAAAPGAQGRRSITIAEQPMVPAAHEPLCLPLRHPYPSRAKFTHLGIRSPKHSAMNASRSERTACCTHPRSLSFSRYLTTSNALLPRACTSGTATASLLVRVPRPQVGLAGGSRSSRSLWSSAEPRAGGALWRSSSPGGLLARLAREIAARTPSTIQVPFRPIGSLGLNVVEAPNADDRPPSDKRLRDHR
jgi:hypothetical protein